MADDSDDDSDLTDFQKFPKYLHRVSPTTADVPPVDPRMHDVTTTTTHDLAAQVDLVYQAGIVDTAEVEADLQAVGWVAHVGAARQAALEAVRREKQRRADEDKDLVKQAVREVLRESLLAGARHSSNESRVKQEPEAAEKQALRKAERQDVVMPRLDDLDWTPTQWALKAGRGPAVAIDYLSGKTIKLHTFATLHLLQDPGRLFWVSWMLGHRHTSTTLNRYTKWVPALAGGSQFAGALDARSPQAKVEAD